MISSHPRSVNLCCDESTASSNTFSSISFERNSTSTSTSTGVSDDGSSTSGSYGSYGSLTRKVHEWIDDRRERQTRQWSGNVKMPCYVDSVFCKDVDINKYVANQRKCNVTFCNKRYDITGGWKGSGWKRLFTDLKAAAMKGGIQLYGNGAVAQKTVKTAMYVLKCCHGRQVRTDVGGKRTEESMQ